MSRRLITMLIASVLGLLTACGDGGKSISKDAGGSTGSTGNAGAVSYASPPNQISTLPLID